MSIMISIKIRGSSSQHFAKKQFTIEGKETWDIDKDFEFLGMPSEEDWIINGPYSDKSLIRNALTFQLAR